MLVRRSIDSDVICLARAQKGKPSRVFFKREASEHRAVLVFGSGFGKNS
jgi:hypothetical protein